MCQRVDGLIWINLGLLRTPAHPGLVCGVNKAHWITRAILLIRAWCWHPPALFPSPVWLGGEPAVPRRAAAGRMRVVRRLCYVAVRELFRFNNEVKPAERESAQAKSRDINNSNKQKKGKIRQLRVSLRAQGPACAFALVCVRAFVRASLGISLWLLGFFFLFLLRLLLLLFFFFFFFRLGQFRSRSGELVVKLSCRTSVDSVARSFRTAAFYLRRAPGRSSAWIVLDEHVNGVDGDAPFGPFRRPLTTQLRRVSASG